LNTRLSHRLRTCHTTLPTALRRARLVAACLLFWTIPLSTVAQLPPTVLQLLQERNIPAEAMALHAIRADGSTVVSFQPERPMTPASTMKVVTAAVALDHLGPTYRGSAALLTHAPVVDGVLQGDLIVRGEGSVELDAEPFARLIEQVRERHGIHTIQGDLIIDRHFFHPARLDLGLPPFDEAPEFRYNVIPDALLLNHNLLRLEMVADAATVKVRMTPALDRVRVESAFTLIDGACARWEDGWQPATQRHADDGSVTLVLRGTFPKQCRANTEINVLDRVLYADRLFRALWSEKGGHLHGVTRDAPAPVASGARVLAEHRSRPLSEFVREINKRSDNTFTRIAFLTLGERPAVKANGEASPAVPTVAQAARVPSVVAADAVVRQWFDRHRIPTAGLVLENGSGLSRSEKISPSQLVQVLRAAERGPWAPEFLASLPIVAIDGTMRNRLRESPVAGRARIKTGTLRDVSGVAGFVRNRDGDWITVAAMINHDLAKSTVARPIVDALLAHLADDVSSRARPAQSAQPPLRKTQAR
jgi:serine-type D-Ala-D-Ala carboxypeptidase/endopeptidase (penicillin-binding protein 4)